MIPVADDIDRLRTQVDRTVMRQALVAIQELHRPVPIYTTESGECEHGDECEGIEIHNGDMYCPDQTDGVTCAECGDIAMNFCVDDGFPEWPCDTRKLADAGLAGEERG